MNNNNSQTTRNNNGSREVRSVFKKLVSIQDQGLDIFWQMLVGIIIISIMPWSCRSQTVLMLTRIRNSRLRNKGSELHRMRFPEFLETRKVPEAVLGGVREEKGKVMRIATVKIPRNQTNSI